MALQIEIKCTGTRTAALADLQDFQGALKKLPAAAAKKLRDSILRHGFRVPIMAWNNKLMDGHQRVVVLKQLQAEGYEVPPIPIVDLQADNEKDAKKLLLLINSRYGRMVQTGFETFVDGFTLPDLDEIDIPDVDLSFLKERIVPECTVPDPPVTSTTKVGDLFKLGSHRLLCGDSTDLAVVDRLLNGEKADLVLTDPPYGVDYTGKTEDALKIENDGEPGLEGLLRDSLALALTGSRPGAVWYVAAPAGPQFKAFATVLTELGVWRQTLTWVKDSMVLGHSDYHYKHEALFYGWTPGAAHHQPPDRTRTSVLEFDRPKASKEHPTMKPLSLWTELMGNSTSKGDLVYDPFLGSGTSILAAEQLGRRCYGLELDPRYVDVVIRRWEIFTGKKAEKL